MLLSQFVHPILPPLCPQVCSTVLYLRLLDAIWFAEGIWEENRLKTL